MSYKYKNSFLLGHIELTEKQSQFHKIMRNPETRVVFISGPAGTAKTFISVYTAIYKHNEDNLLKILYLRSLAESAEKGLGFLKGSMDDKFNPYIGPLEDKLDELLSPHEKQQIQQRNAVDAAPINFIRGATWRNKVVIVDEAQNMTIKELTTVITRIVQTLHYLYVETQCRVILGPLGLKNFVRSSMMKKVEVMGYIIYILRRMML